MRFDPLMRALRSDDAPQREAQAALLATREAWLADPRGVPLFEELARYGAGDEFAACPALGSTLRERATARAFAEILLDHLLPGLRERPLGMVPFRHVSERGVASLLLARIGRALLMLSAREPGSYSATAAGFSDGERHEIVLAGAGKGRLVTLLGIEEGAARLEFEDFAFEPGTRHMLDQSSQSLLVESVAQRLVVLRLIRNAEAPRPSREFALADGALRHQASGDVGESRHEMMLALLGRMGRRDAAPVMVELARAESSGASTHLRWQALRECLALDSATGFRALSKIACNADDPLAAQAGALRAQLIEAHPALAALEHA